MSVGLYDMDMATYLAVPPNLEIMKLSTYFKRRREVVVFAPSFSPEKNTHFYLRKDYNDGIYPKNIADSYYGGLAFTNNVYKPLLEEIEQCAPDPIIYDKMVNKIYIFCNNKGISRKLVKDIYDGEHVRLSLDNKTVWNKFYKQFKNLNKSKSIMFHDYNIGEISNSFEVISKLIKKQNDEGKVLRMGTKFPIKINEYKELLKWSSLPANSFFFGIEYNGILDREQFLEYSKQTFEKNVFKNTHFNVVSGCTSLNDFIENRLLKILEMTIISRIYNTEISLVYSDDFFIEDGWKELIRLLNFYIHWGTDNQVFKALDMTTTSLWDFCNILRIHKINRNFMSREEGFNVLEFLKKKCPHIYEIYVNCTFENLKEMIPNE